ncbi:SRPBCC domain-containing protein [Streptomyces sp. S1A1-8]|uniref:SRPBCC family protein n=1 Tax=Streptomyces TaxID=1883 RepID=UPI001164309A|nr:MULTISPECIES: SRPBCC domain-containing protein [unclassified Streptomyces]QDN95239.1 SRPBCC domain-containing protein [Streptomyces sp. RLB1-9]QDO16963.1 SRPBCC domain-containing protein [Streptomyces sp. S1A1-8]QDO27086.1 SRPBCC domain-containing protein [Streptomyces sp. S1A1-3]
MTTTDPTVINCEQFIAHPPAAVWKALTDPELHARWWAAGDVRPVVGHRFTLDMGQWGQQPCEVLTVEPERLLRYSFASGTLDTTITWRLQGEGTGTRLFLEHAGFDLDSPLGKAAVEGMGNGWPGLLRRIESVLGAAVR